MKFSHVNLVRSTLRLACSYIRPCR